jgi:hypothetical protein
MDNATAGTLLFVFLTVALCAMLFWDNIGRRFWYDLSDSLGEFGDWLRTRRWAEAFSALRTGQVSYGAVGVETPLAAPVIRLPRDYVTRTDAIPHQQAPSAPSVVRPSAPSALERLQVDRTREGLLDALVAAGWSTTQIRAHLKGTNEVIGQEIEAARARLAAPVVTPLAGRVVPPGVRFEAE